MAMEADSGSVSFTKIPVGIQWDWLNYIPQVIIMIFVWALPKKYQGAGQIL